MAATSVPQLIAYAETVGYAGYRGLSTAGAPLFVWGVATGMLPLILSAFVSYTDNYLQLSLQTLDSQNRFSLDERRSYFSYSCNGQN
jgi:hypothetical protein